MKMKFVSSNKRKPSCKSNGFHRYCKLKLKCKDQSLQTFLSKTLFSHRRNAFEYFSISNLSALESVSPAPVRSDTEHSKSGPGPHWPRRLQIPEPGTVFCPLSPEPAFRLGWLTGGKNTPLLPPLEQNTPINNNVHKKPSTGLLT